VKTFQFIFLFIILLSYVHTSKNYLEVFPSLPFPSHLFTFFSFFFFFFSSFSCFFFSFLLLLLFFLFFFFFFFLMKSTYCRKCFENLRELLWSLKQSFQSLLSQESIISVRLYFTSECYYTNIVIVYHSKTNHIHTFPCHFTAFEESEDFHILRKSKTLNLIFCSWTSVVLMASSQTQETDHSILLSLSCQINQHHEAYNKTFSSSKLHVLALEELCQKLWRGAKLSQILFRGLGLGACENIIV